MKKRWMMNNRDNKTASSSTTGGGFPKKKKAQLGDFVWALVGKSEHACHLIENPAETGETGGVSEGVWVQWSSNGMRECIPANSIIQNTTKESVTRGSHYCLRRERKTPPQAAQDEYDRLQREVQKAKKPPQPGRGHVVGTTAAATAAPVKKTKRKSQLGTFTWALVGKTEHPCHIIENYPVEVDASDGSKRVWVEWSSNRKRESIPVSSIIPTTTTTATSTTTTSGGGEGGGGACRRMIRRNCPRKRKTPLQAAQEERERLQREVRAGTAVEKICKRDGFDDLWAVARQDNEKKREGQHLRRSRRLMLRRSTRNAGQKKHQQHEEGDEEEYNSSDDDDINYPGRSGGAAAAREKKEKDNGDVEIGVLDNNHDDGKAGDANNGGAGKNERRKGKEYKSGKQVDRSPLEKQQKGEQHQQQQEQQPAAPPPQQGITTSANRSVPHMDKDHVCCSSGYDDRRGVVSVKAKEAVPTATAYKEDKLVIDTSDDNDSDDHVSLAGACDKPFDSSDDDYDNASLTGTPSSTNHHNENNYAETEEVGFVTQPQHLEPRQHATMQRQRQQQQQQHHVVQLQRSRSDEQHEEDQFSEMQQVTPCLSKQRQQMSTSSTSPQTATPIGTDENRRPTAANEEDNEAVATTMAVADAQESSAPTVADKVAVEKKKNVGIHRGVRSLPEDCTSGNATLSSSSFLQFLQPPHEQKWRRGTA